MIKVAIAYDFDGTLAKGNIQENSYLPDIGIEKAVFWKEVGAFAKKHEMDEILAYMRLLLMKADESGVKYSRKEIAKHGKSVKYFTGVKSFFGIINTYAKKKNIILEHYIISSGTKEMIEKTSIAKEFKQIYASSFQYDQNDIPVWPAIAVNYTTKTQFLFRINKGIENTWDNKEINKFTSRKQRYIPFENIIYIGDGDTDIPAMRVVKANGGNSIAVYPLTNEKNKRKAHKLLKEERADYCVPADYRKGKKLMKVLELIVSQISLRQMHD